MTDSYCFHLGDLCTVFDTSFHNDSSLREISFSKNFSRRFASAVLQQEASFSADILHFFFDQHSCFKSSVSGLKFRARIF